MRHYTQDPSELCSELEAEGVLHVQGRGFVTRDMIAALARRLEGPPQDLLVDMRDVAGYDAECAPAARALLFRAAAAGVHRVAIVAQSSVLRAATDLAAARTGLMIRTFEHDTSARQWLASS